PREVREAPIPSGRGERSGTEKVWCDVMGHGVKTMAWPPESAARPVAVRHGPGAGSRAPTCRESDRCSRAPCSAAAAWFGRQGLGRIVYYRCVARVQEVRTCPYVAEKSIWRASGTGAACG